MTATTSTRWDEYWTPVGNEDWHAARRLLELSPRVRGFFASHLVDIQVPTLDDEGNDVERGRRTLTLDWEEAAARIDGEGLSSTEQRLARLVAALTTGKPLDLLCLTRMNSWSNDVWRILTEWGTDGRATREERP